MNKEKWENSVPLRINGQYKYKLFSKFKRFGVKRVDFFYIY